MKIHIVQVAKITGQTSTLALCEVEGVFESGETVEVVPAAEVVELIAQLERARQTIATLQTPPLNEIPTPPVPAI